MPAIAFPSNQKALGSIAETNRANLDGVSALSGATVYAGDVVETDNQGALHLQLGSGQLFLSPSSSASLENRAGLATVTLARGSATFSLPDPLQFELETPAGTVRGSGTHVTNGQVVILGPSELTVTATRGALVIDNDGDLHTIAEGKSYRIVIEEDDSAPAGANDQAPKKARKHRRKLLFFLIGGATVVAATIPFWRLGSQSPYPPSH
jgi:hypothetical protein